MISASCHSPPTGTCLQLFPPTNQIAPSAASFPVVRLPLFPSVTPGIRSTPFGLDFAKSQGDVSSSDQFLLLQPMCYALMFGRESPVSSQRDGKRHSLTFFRHPILARLVSCTGT